MNRMRPVLLILAVLVATGLSILGPSCSRSGESTISADILRRCMILSPAEPQGDRSWAMWLDRHMADVARGTWANAGEAMQYCLENDAALIVHGEPLPPDAEDLLAGYLQRGGRLVALGYHHPLALSTNDVLRATIGFNGAPFPLKHVQLHVAGEASGLRIDNLPVQSISPPAMGCGGARAAPGRWIPVVEAVDGEKNLRGWAGSLNLHRVDEGTYSIAGWLGLNPTLPAPDDLTTAVHALLEAATRDIYMIQYGIDRHSAYSRHLIGAAARILDRRRERTPLRLAARWLSDDGLELRRHISPPLERSGELIRLPVGLAPDVPASGSFSRRFTLELLVRDRNDQITMDVARQDIKIFSREAPAAAGDRLSVEKNQFVHNGMPVFMLGVNYRPRIAAPSGPGDNTRHWLNPEWYPPEIVRSDLDLLAAAGVNAIAIEYTDAVQAPQVLHLLDELRRRSMWAMVYLPALHPFDLRLDEGLRMIDEINLSRWPELFALEVARGLTVGDRSDLRRFDDAWEDWLEEHFSSITEAEQKLGISLWRDRGKIAGPPGASLRSTPPQDRAAALYRSFLTDFVSRRLGYVREMLRAREIPVMLTARSAYGWPEAWPAHVTDTLDISAGALHQDFLSADAWTIHPLHSDHADGDRMAAYLRGVAEGKPVVWSAFGQGISDVLHAGDLLRQQEVYEFLLSRFVDGASSGAFAWRFSPGPATGTKGDWGLVDASGSWRPVEDAIRNARLRLRQARPRPPAPVIKPAAWMLSARELETNKENRQGIFSPPGDEPAVTLWQPPGHGKSTGDLLRPGGDQAWSPIDGLYMLNSEWRRAGSDGQLRPVQPGEHLRLYAGKTMRAEIMNSGSLAWETANTRREGTVWIKAYQPGFPEEWIPAPRIERGGRFEITWTAKKPGLWELQPVLSGYGKFGQRLLVEVTTPPGLY